MWRREEYLKGVRLRFKVIALSACVCVCDLSVYLSGALTDWSIAGAAAEVHTLIQANS